MRGGTFLAAATVDYNHVRYLVICVRRNEHLFSSVFEDTSSLLAEGSVLGSSVNEKPNASGFADAEP